MYTHSEFQISVKFKKKPWAIRTPGPILVKGYGVPPGPWP